MLKADKKCHVEICGIYSDKDSHTGIKDIFRHVNSSFNLKPRPKCNDKCIYTIPLQSGLSFENSRYVIRMLNLNNSSSYFAYLLAFAMV